MVVRRLCLLCCLLADVRLEGRIRRDAARDRSEKAASQLGDRIGAAYERLLEAAEAARRVVR